MPYLTVDMRAEEIQCDLWSVAEMAAKDERVKVLEQQLDESNKHIDELEKKFEATNKNLKESDKVRKLNFDNQILMGQLSQYKKAEKNVKEIANDYESMKLKYFNVLTENAKQKTQL